MVSFASPWALLLLAFPVALLALVIHQQSRATRDAIAFSDAALLEELRLSRVSQWRRRIPVIGMLAALIVATLAAAEPQRLGPVESSQSTVVLALDTSVSMLATDVTPSRIDAARSAALDFIAAAPSDTRIGIVSFSSRVDVLAVPTTDRSILTTAIENLTTDGGTAIGDALYAAMSLLDTAGWVADSTDPSRSIQLRTGAIVVMSDGSTNAGRPDADATSAAEIAGVPVYTVAFGTPNGVINLNGNQIAVPIEPEPLAEIADTTGGEAYEALTASDLSRVFEDLARTVAVQQALKSVAHVFAAIAVMLVFGSAALWVRYGSRL